MKISIGCDHAGVDAKNKVIEFLKEQKHEVIDQGTYTTDSIDYPDYAHKVCQDVLENKADKGILICGTGIGMSIAANKHKGIRAAVCTEPLSAYYTRQHNDANVLCMGARVTGEDMIKEIVKTFIDTDFSQGERHINRIAKITKLEEK